MTSLRKQEQRVVRAAMAYWRYAIDTDRLDVDSEKVAALDAKINRACAALAKMKKERK